MRLYSKKLHRYVERQVHFGVGQSVKTACGLVLFSRHVMVSIFSLNDGTMITDDLSRVTCKRCLKTKDIRLRKLIAIEKLVPGIFDHEALCSEQWLLKHALDISKARCDTQKLEVTDGTRKITLSSAMKSRDRKYVLHNLTQPSGVVNP